MDLTPSSCQSPAVVLAVDDDAVTRTIISAFLSRHGIGVATAGDGAQMWQVLERTTPKIILLDVEMPGEDGFALAQRLRARYGLAVTIIMLTARGKGGDKQTGIELGVDDYFTKPCDLQNLLNVVHRYLATGAAPPQEPSLPTTCVLCGSKLEHTMRSAAGSVLACSACGWSRFVDA